MLETLVTGITEIVAELICANVVRVLTLGFVRPAPDYGPVSFDRKYVDMDDESRVILNRQLAVIFGFIMICFAIAAATYIYRNFPD